MKTIIKKIVKKILGKGAETLPPLPTKQRSDDIYLASFPRSGNTWVSFLIANAINEHLKMGMSVNFFNIHFFIPDIHVSKDIPSNLEFKPFRRIIKSHANVTKHYKNVILLIRNPEDVMISYYDFLTKLGKYGGSISSFIRDEKLGVKAWMNHTTGWLEQSSPSQRIRLFTYENFKKDTEGELRKMFNLMGHNLNDEVIRAAVKKSSADEMKRLEKETISVSTKRYNKFKFVRQGKASKENELSEEDKGFIRRKTKKIIEKHIENKHQQYEHK